MALLTWKGEARTLNDKPAAGALVYAVPVTDDGKPTVVDTDADVVYNGATPIVCGGDGRFTGFLVAGVAYRVQVRTSDGQGNYVQSRAGWIDAAASGTVDLSDAIENTGAVPLPPAGVTEAQVDQMIADALEGFEGGGSGGAVASVNGQTGAVSLAAADVGAVPTSRTVAGKPLSANVTLVPGDVGAATAAQGAKADTAVQPGALAAVATSGSAADLTGTLPTAVLPPLAINETFTAANQTAMLALTAQRGDMAIRTDNGRTYVLSTDSPSTLADWKEVQAAGQVVSVAGKNGTVSLVKGDVGLGNVDNTADSAKEFTAAQTTSGTFDAARIPGSTVGKQVLAAADAAAARSAIGAGTSNLALGTTDSTAKAGNWAPAIADVTGLVAALADKAADEDLTAALATIVAHAAALEVKPTWVHYDGGWPARPVANFVHWWGGTEATPPPAVTGDAWDHPA